MRFHGFVYPKQPMKYPCMDSYAWKYNLKLNLSNDYMTGLATRHYQRLQFMDYSLWNSFGSWNLFWMFHCINYVRIPIKLSNRVKIINNGVSWPSSVYYRFLLKHCVIYTTTVKWQYMHWSVADPAFPLPYPVELRTLHKRIKPPFELQSRSSHARPTIIIKCV